MTKSWLCLAKYSSHTERKHTLHLVLGNGGKKRFYKRMTKVTPGVLKEVRQKHGASSKEYKEALGLKTRINAKMRK